MQVNKSVTVTFTIKKTFILLSLLVVATLLTAQTCDTASVKERNQTVQNRNIIAESILVPEMTYSSRRFVMARFYQALNNPRLRSCTMVTARGANGNSGSDLLGIAETIGVPVNLSNQMTAGNMAEPDTIFTGDNDQTVFVLRNGVAMVSEGDTHAIIGDCPLDVHPGTEYQQVIDYNAKKPEGSGEVNFLPQVDASGRFIPDRTPTATPKR